MPLLTDLIEPARTVPSKPACRCNSAWIRLVCTVAFSIPAVIGTLSAAEPAPSQSPAAPVINEIMYHPAEEQEALNNGISSSKTSTSML